MGLLNVKITILGKSLQYVAPDLCTGCSFFGTILCEHCKYDINYESFEGCVLCANPTFVGICNKHTDAPFSRAWVVGERHGALLNLLDEYKFQRVARADSILAELLDVRLPFLPANTVVIPVPTNRSHVRQRGYDHCLRIAREFARRRQLAFDSPLESHSRWTQHFSNKADRQRQVKNAFSLTKTLDVSRPHLIIDDIVTTGATLLAVAEALRQAGVSEIWAAAVARQPLD